MPAPSLSAETVVARTPGVLDVTVGGAVILHDPNTDRYARLNSTAAHVWERLARSASVTELAVDLAARYGLATERAARDIEGLVGSLLDRGVVRVVEASAG